MLRLLSYSLSLFTGKMCSFFSSRCAGSHSRGATRSVQTCSTNVWCEKERAKKKNWKIIIIFHHIFQSFVNSGSTEKYNKKLLTSSFSSCEVQIVLIVCNQPRDVDDMIKVELCRELKHDERTSENENQGASSLDKKVQKAHAKK